MGMLMDIPSERPFTDNTRRENMFTHEQFNALAQKYMDCVFRLAFSYLKCRADADDVTQNVFICLYKTDKVFESEAHIKHWLIRVTVNECKKLWRSPWRKTEDLDEYANTMPFEDEHHSDLFQAIMALDKKYRTVIVLYYCEGYSISEIAEILNIPTGTVGTRLDRARRKLRLDLMEVCDHV